MSSAGFPEVQGGGSLILAWQVRNKHVLVIGGGEVSILPILAPEKLRNPQSEPTMANVATCGIYTKEPHG